MNDTVNVDVVQMFIKYCNINKFGGDCEVVSNRGGQPSTAGEGRNTSCQIVSYAHTKSIDVNSRYNPDVSTELLRGVLWKVQWKVRLGPKCLPQLEPSGVRESRYRI